MPDFKIITYNECDDCGCPKNPYHIKNGCSEEKNHEYRDWIDTEAKEDYWFAGDGSVRFKTCTISEAENMGFSEWGSLIDFKDERRDDCDGICRADETESCDDCRENECELCDSCEGYWDCDPPKRNKGKLCGETDKCCECKYLASGDGRCENI